MDNNNETNSTNESQDNSASQQEISSDGQFGYDDGNSTSSLHESAHSEAISTAIMEVSGELMLGKFTPQKSHSGGSESSDISDDDIRRACSGGAIAKYPESSTGLSDNDWNPYATESDTNQTPRSPPRSPTSNNSDDQNRVGFISKATISIGPSVIKPKESKPTVSVRTGQSGEVREDADRDDKSNKGATAGSANDKLDIFKYVMGSETRQAADNKQDRLTSRMSTQQSLESDTLKNESGDYASSGRSDLSGSGTLSGRPSSELDRDVYVRESVDSEGGVQSGRQSAESAHSGRSSRSDNSGHQSSDSQLSKGSQQSRQSQISTGQSATSDRSDRLDQFGFSTASSNINELIQFETAQRGQAEAGDCKSQSSVTSTESGRKMDDPVDSVSHMRLSARLEPYTVPVHSAKSPERSSKGPTGSGGSYVSIAERERLLSDSPEFPRLLAKHEDEQNEPRTYKSEEEEVARPAYRTTDDTSAPESSSRSPSQVSMRRVTSLFEETKRQAREAVAIARPEPSGSEERFPLRERLTVSKHDDSFKSGGDSFKSGGGGSEGRLEKSRDSDTARSMNSEEVARVMGKYDDDNDTVSLLRQSEAVLANTDALIGGLDTGAGGEGYGRSSHVSVASIANESDDELAKRVKAILAQTDRYNTNKGSGEVSASGEYVPRTIDYTRLERDLQEIQDNLQDANSQPAANDSLHHLRKPMLDGRPGSNELVSTTTRDEYLKSLETTGTTTGGRESGVSDYGRESGVSEYGRRLVWDHGADLQYEEGFAGQFIGTRASTDTASSRQRSSDENDKHPDQGPGKSAYGTTCGDREGASGEFHDPMPRHSTGSDITRAERIVEQVLNRRPEGDLKESVEDIIARYRNERKDMYDRLHAPEQTVTMTTDASSRHQQLPSLPMQARHSERILADPEIGLTVTQDGDARQPVNGKKKQPQPGLADAVLKILTTGTHEAEMPDEKGMAKKVYKILASDRPQEQVNGILTETMAVEHEMLRKLVAKPKEDSSLDDSGLNASMDSFEEKDVRKQLEYSQYSSPGKGDRSEMAALRDVTSAPYSALSNAKSLLSNQLQKMSQRNFDKSVELRTPCRQTIDCYTLYGMQKDDPKTEVREAWMPARRMAASSASLTRSSPEFDSMPGRRSAMESDIGPPRTSVPVSRERALANERFYLTGADGDGARAGNFAPLSRPRTYSDPDSSPAKRAREAHSRSKSEEPFDVSDISQYSFKEAPYSPDRQPARNTRRIVPGGEDLVTPQQHRQAKQKVPVKRETTFINRSRRREWSFDFYTSLSDSSDSMYHHGDATITDNVLGYHRNQIYEPMSGQRREAKYGKEHTRDPEDDTYIPNLLKSPTKAHGKRSSKREAEIRGHKMQQTSIVSTDTFNDIGNKVSSRDKVRSRESTPRRALKVAFEEDGGRSRSDQRREAKYGKDSRSKSECEEIEPQWKVDEMKSRSHESSSRSQQSSSRSQQSSSRSPQSSSRSAYMPDGEAANDVPVPLISDGVYELLLRSQAQEVKLAQLQRNLFPCPPHNTTSSSSEQSPVQGQCGSQGHPESNYGNPVHTRRKHKLKKSFNEDYYGSSPSPPESDTSGSKKAARMRPYRPFGSRDMYYTESGEETNDTATTIESTHPGSDDAAPPYIPQQFLGSRRDAHTSHPTGIYGNKDGLSSADGNTVKTGHVDRARSPTRVVSSTSNVDVQPSTVRQASSKTDTVSSRPSDGGDRASYGSNDPRSGVTADTGYLSTRSRPSDRQEDIYNMRPGPGRSQSTCDNRGVSVGVSRSDVNHSENSNRNNTVSVGASRSDVNHSGNSNRNNTDKLGSAETEYAARALKTREEFQRELDRRERELREVLTGHPKQDLSQHDILAASSRSDPGGMDNDSRWEYQDADANNDFQRLSPEPAYPQDRLRCSRSRSEADLVVLSPDQDQKYSSPVRPGTRFLELSTHPSPIYSHQDSLTIPTAASRSGPTNELQKLAMRQSQSAGGGGGSGAHNAAATDLPRATSEQAGSSRAPFREPARPDPPRSAELPTATQQHHQGGVPASAGLSTVDYTHSSNGPPASNPHRYAGAHIDSGPHSVPAGELPRLHPEQERGAYNSLPPNVNRDQLRHMRSDAVPHGMAATGELDRAAIRQVQSEYAPVYPDQTQGGPVEQQHRYPQSSVTAIPRTSGPNAPNNCYPVRPLEPGRVAVGDTNRAGPVRSHSDVDLGADPRRIPSHMRIAPSGSEEQVGQELRLEQIQATGRSQSPLHVRQKEMEAELEDIDRQLTDQVTSIHGEQPKEECFEDNFPPSKRAQALREVFEQEYNDNLPPNLNDMWTRFKEHKELQSQSDSDLNSTRLDNLSGLLHNPTLHAVHSGPRASQPKGPSSNEAQQRAGTRDTNNSRAPSSKESGKTSGNEYQSKSKESLKEGKRSSNSTNESVQPGSGCRFADDEAGTSREIESRGGPGNRLTERELERKQAAQRSQKRQEKMHRHGLSEEESNGSYTELIMEQERKRERMKRDARKEEKRERKNKSPNNRNKSPSNRNKSPSNRNKSPSSRTTKSGNEERSKKGKDSGSTDQATVTAIRNRKVAAAKHSDSMDTLFSIPEDASFEQSPSKAESEMKSRQKRQRHVIDPLMKKLRDKIKVQRVKIDKERRKELQRVEKLKKLELLLTAKRKGRLSDKAIGVELEYDTTSSSFISHSETSTIMSDSCLTGLSTTAESAASSTEDTLTSSTLDSVIRLQVKKYPSNHGHRSPSKQVEYDSQESSDFNNIIVERIQESKENKKMMKDKSSKGKKYRVDESGNKVRKDKGRGKSKGVFGVELTEKDMASQIQRYERYMTPERQRRSRDVCTMYPSPITVSPPARRRTRDVLMKSEAIQTSPSVRSTSPSYSYDEAPVAPVPYMSRKKEKTSHRRPATSPGGGVQFSTQTSPPTRDSRIRPSSKSPHSTARRPASRSPDTRHGRKTSGSPPRSRFSPQITRRQAQSPIWKPENEIIIPPHNGMFTPEYGDENKAPGQHSNKPADAWVIDMKAGQPWKQPLRERQAFAVRQEPWKPKSIPQSTWKEVDAIMREREAGHDMSRDTLFTLDPDGQRQDPDAEEDSDESVDDIMKAKSLSKMSLQEAFAAQKQETISRLRRRQKRLNLAADQRKMEVYLKMERDRIFQEERRKEANPDAHPYSAHLHKPARRVISKEEMREMTQKRYKKLPEIQQQKEMKKRQDDYSLNRIKARLFNRKIQKQVLIKANKWGR